jgi:hypothetical protein
MQQPTNVIRKGCGEPRSLPGVWGQRPLCVQRTATADSADDTDSVSHPPVAAEPIATGAQIDRTPRSRRNTHFNVRRCLNRRWIPGATQFLYEFAFEMAPHPRIPEEREARLEGCGGAGRTLRDVLLRRTPQGCGLRLSSRLDCILVLSAFISVHQRLHCRWLSAYGAAPPRIPSTKVVVALAGPRGVRAGGVRRGRRAPARRRGCGCPGWRR